MLGISNSENESSLLLRETTAWMQEVGRLRERLPRDRVREISVVPYPASVITISLNLDFQHREACMNLKTLLQSAALLAIGAGLMLVVNPKGTGQSTE